MAVVVVTDSSSRLCAETRTAHGIRQVPLHVLVEGADFSDGVDEIPPDICDFGHVTTAGATPTELADAYDAALTASGGDGVVAVHISAALSSTFSAGLQAARRFGPKVRVVNSRSAAMGVGFVALAAARSAADGSDLDGVEDAARRAVPRVRGFVVVSRLDNLRRSGRIGTAATWLSSALAIKPLLQVDPDGRLVLVQRVRTLTKSVAAMVERVVDEVGERDAQLAVHHVADPAAAAALAGTLEQRLPHCAPATTSDMGPVLAVHLGAGALGVIVALGDDASAATTAR
ncbi:DegV family protein [Mycobacterium sp. MYCO198283]|uniref:DegV family protein n=1 Tax=Mycobacterium sp. MYCO198283 TaxID=2883505 RepID=UPI001E2F478B|nr:DegV family protein [Mycobacterium sp. MYCO198283]MCG5432500.1 DegV family protein [Mycobacterium sp. MYCO198283]